MQVYRHVLPPSEKLNFLQLLATQFGVQGEAVKSAVDKWQQGEASAEDWDGEVMLRSADRLQQACQPLYSSLFTPISNQPGGIKFLLDLRADVLDAIHAQPGHSAHLHVLSERIRRSLAEWFSLGMLQLERITWEQSSAALLQKVMRYEAVHHIQGWDALRLRLLPNRRVYAFFHPSLPDEPLVLLHTALTDHVAASMPEVLEQEASQELAYEHAARQATTAVFYSVSSTQAGLAGVDLGNFLIKQVAHQLQKDLPNIRTLVTLSPMPNFRRWLLTQLQKEKQQAMAQSKQHERGERLLTLGEERALSQHAQEAASLSVSPYYRALDELEGLLDSDNLLANAEAEAIMQPVLMRLAACYLLKERRRQLALDPVANFHLRNGAMLYALRWRADLSAQGLRRSWGIMVNYKYLLEDVQSNNRAYLVDNVIHASDAVKALL
ncbi:hypothetical protein WJX72_000493 [[Myrmecia] bisecta]|uniref:Malonyl-CoA decarboxylase n=1 Tax=[Myrmecia] bisecta TaxID=41462 RepID=A0AAW1Q5B9_9CHLO